MWVHPLQPSVSEDENKLILLAPNRFIVDWVREKYLEKIKDIYAELHDGVMPTIDVMVGDVRANKPPVSVPKPPAESSGAVAPATVRGGAKTLQQVLTSQVKEKEKRV